MTRKRNNQFGFSHHLLLPLFALFAVGIIGVTTAHLTSAATYTSACLSKTLSNGSKGTCVKDVQTIVGVSPDGIYGPITKAAVKKLTGATQLKANSSAWETVCNSGKAAGSGSKFTAYQKACLTPVYRTRLCAYTSPSVKTVPPKKLQCSYKNFATLKAAKKQQDKNYKLAEKYKKDYTVYLAAIKLDPNSALYKNLVVEFKQRYDGAKRVSGVIQKVDAKTGVLIQ